MVIPVLQVLCLTSQQRVIERRTRRTRPMNPSTTSGPADATGIENLHSTAPVDGATSTASPTGPAPGSPPAKAPVWMKTRPLKPPPEKQKPPRLGEKMKHLSPLFESQTNKLQWTMHDNAKCMLDLCEKIHRKTENLSRPENAHYYDKDDLDPEIRRESLNKPPSSIVPVG